jgi:hypothetical protein
VLEEVKNNATLWFNWMHNSTNGFGDEYLSNYYIRRLTSGFLKHSTRKNYTKALLCFKKHQCDPDIDMMSIIPKAVCSLKVNEDVSNKLNLAKRILKEHFVVIILERIHELKAALSLARILHQDSITDIAELLSLEQNKGILTYTPTQASSYTWLMPQSVLETLIYENAADIALYNYSVALYEVRGNPSVQKRKVA